MHNARQRKRSSTILSTGLQPTWRGRLAIFALVLLAAPAISAASQPGSLQKPVEYMIVVTGGELLSGAYPDGHTHFLTQTLRPLGLECVGSMCVDDKQSHLTAALRFAREKASLVIVTGGLGPTDNDITRETLSAFTEIPIEEHPEVLAAMQRRFKTAQLRENLRRQSQVPIQGTYLKNSNGTATGLVFDSTDYVVVALPGPPRELQPMVRDELVPYLSRRFGTRLPGCSLTLRFVGLGQSQIDQTLDDLVPLPADVTVSSQFEGSRVDFTFTLPDDTPDDRARLENLKQKILEHLGENVYAEDETSLEEQVVRLLEAGNATLTLMEVASGGSLTAGLSAGDNHRVLAGAYVASTEAQLARLLAVSGDQWTGSTSSEQRTMLLVQAAARITGSQWALAVGEAQAAENGTRYVEVVFRHPNGDLESQRVGLRGTDEISRFRLTTRLLDQLRRRLVEFRGNR